MQRSAARFGKDPRYFTPGVYFEEPAPDRAVRVSTGQPVFLGLAQPAESSAAEADVRIAWLTAYEQFGERVGSSPAGGFLTGAVRGFFENGGERCLVVSSAPSDGADAHEQRWMTRLDRWLDRLDWAEHAEEAVDLVCAPDLPETYDVRLRLQQRLLEHCDRAGNRFAILDAAPGRDREKAAAQWHTLVSPNGALYYPWLLPPDAGAGWAPPCGHVAGVYARTDRRVGPYKAPANEAIAGAVDVQDPVTDEEQAYLNDVGVNCIRVRPGRGIRIWGARTLSGRAEWRYVNVRRLFITVRRRLEIECRDLVFEGNDPPLWERMRERLNGYCYTLYQAGALKGLTAEEAYYVKCDEETNPRARRDAGEVTAEIGLAPTKPAEFIVVRITWNAAGGATESPSFLTEGS